MVLVNFWSIYLDVRTLKYTLSANAAMARRGEIHYGIPGWPKSAQVAHYHCTLLGNLEHTWQFAILETESYLGAN